MDIALCKFLKNKDARHLGLSGLQHLDSPFLAGLPVVRDKFPDASINTTISHFPSPTLLFCPIPSPFPYSSFFFNGSPGCNPQKILKIETRVCVFLVISLLMKMSRPCDGQCDTTLMWPLDGRSVSADVSVD
jgi:molybdopterin-guanine dinucleotide biosynthesis protein A